ncbi:MAG TPA: cyclic 2,3-diphosphoglycerate synthase [Gaiellaceae bacterium]|nr:cyclic 2,3-diphosphoglycerate synthase [Gaiellaceae bacterium]
MRRVLIMGAGGRDFHDFNTVYREDASVRVVAFTATQIPGIADRVYPPSLAGPLYPEGIPIRPEEELVEIVRTENVDTVVLSYSDLRHEDVMHKASRVLATGADFTLLGPHATMLEASKPVVAVTAVRTGCGKSPTSRRIGSVLLSSGLRVGLVRHPMPYGDLEAMRVQRFTSLEEIDAAHPTLEEREEYEAPVSMGMPVFAGVDYAAVLELAQTECDVLVWDGGNNDLPFVRPDLHIVVTDPLRVGDELTYHPGEANLVRADVVVINKVDSAERSAVAGVLEHVESVNPFATVVMARSPVTLEPGPSLEGKRVLVVEDGPTLTHGGMAFGAGTVAALQGRAAELVDPRPYAHGAIADVFSAYPHIGRVLPAMGYSDEMLRELEATIDAAEADVVVAGTPIDLGRLITTRHPVRRARYELQEVGRPTLADALAPLVRLLHRPASAAEQRS